MDKILILKKNLRSADIFFKSQYRALLGCTADAKMNLLKGMFKDMEQKFSDMPRLL